MMIAKINQSIDIVHTINSFWNDKIVITITFPPLLNFVIDYIAKVSKLMSASSFL